MNNSEIKLSLDEEQRDRLKVEIEQAMMEIQTLRDKQRLEDKIVANLDLYEGNMTHREGPWPGSANHHLHLTSYMVDIATIKAKKQTLDAKPMIVLEPKPESLEDKKGFRESNLTNREQWLDYKLRKDIEIAEVLNNVYREACIQGTSVMKVPYNYETENVTYTETYQPTEEDYERFKWDTRDRAGQKKREENLEKLGSYEDFDIDLAVEQEIEGMAGVGMERELDVDMNIPRQRFVPGEEVTIKVDEERVVCDGPKPYRVPLKDFYVNPKVKDLRHQRLIAERMIYNWTDVDYRVRTGYYDEDKIEEIKEAKGKDDYYKKNYVFYESIIFTDIEKEGEFKKYVITFEEDTKTIVRAIHYPYRHGEISYIPYYIKARDDNFYGYGYGERLKDYNEMMDSLWNMAMDQASLRAKPPMVSTSDSDSYQNVEWGPGAFFNETEVGKVRPFTMEYGGMESVELMQIVQRVAEQTEGITSGMSGRSDPVDPNAPAAKTAMLLKQANIRVEDVIKSLQAGNAMLAKQIEGLVMQYNPEDLVFYHGENLMHVDPDDMDLNVRYVPHGTTTAVNKSLEMNNILHAMQVVGQIAPELFQDAEKKYLFVSMLIDTLGGTVERFKDDIIPDEEEKQRMNAMKQQQAQQQAGMQEQQATGQRVQQARQILENLDDQTLEELNQRAGGMS